MDEYIDRKDLLKVLDGIWDCADMTFPNGRDHCCDMPQDCKGCKWRDTLEAVKEIVKHRPAAKVGPVREGAWIERESGMMVCSFCHMVAEMKNGAALSLCPNCGAKMGLAVIREQGKGLAQKRAEKEMEKLRKLMRGGRENG